MYAGWVRRMVSGIRLQSPHRFHVQSSCKEIRHLGRYLITSPNITSHRTVLAFRMCTNNCINLLRMSFDALTPTNIMPPSLRQRLTKRQAKGDLKTPGSDCDSRSSTETLADRPRKTAEIAVGSKIAFDDLSSSPPPPPPPPKSPLAETMRRVSPSQSIINRYKQRAPAAVAPRVSAPELKINPKSGKDTRFSEHFDNELSQTSPESMTSSSTLATPIDGAPISPMTNGAEHATTASRKDAEQIQGIEGIPKLLREDGVKLLDLTPPAKRVTRSTARREQRADSGACSLEDKREKPKLIEIRKSSTSSSSSEKASNTDVPKGLTIRKVGSLPRTPSPPPNEDQAHQTAPEKPAKASSTPANSPNFSRPLVPRPLINLCKNNSNSPADESAFYPSPDHASGLSPDLISPVSRSPSPAPGSSRPNTGFLKDGTGCGLTIVNPPRFDPTRLIQHQWCSHLLTTSRPDSPWNWVKRWTCCHCHGQTIVEQLDCSRLDCGHGRCGSGCKLIRSAVTAVPLYA